MCVNMKQVKVNLLWTERDESGNHRWSLSTPPALLLVLASSWVVPEPPQSNPRAV